MARNGVHKTLLISSLSFLKDLGILVMIPILFLCDVLNQNDMFNKKSKSYFHQEELVGEETKCNLDEEEEGLIEITLVREAEEEELENAKNRRISKEQYYEEMIMEIWDEIEAEDNLIEIDISIGSIV